MKPVKRPAWRTGVPIRSTHARLSRCISASLCALGLSLSLFAMPARALAPTPEPGLQYAPGKFGDWREEYAYAVGIHAYIFGYPWIYGATLRHQWITQYVNDDTAHMAVNQFWTAPRLVNARWRDGGTPNNDTLYSIAWADLDQEPLILSVPDTGNRYYTIQLTGMDSDNFASVGQRNTGNKAANYAIVGPDWKGKLPKGVQALPPSPTRWALLWGRTLVTGGQDMPAAQAIAHQYRLTPLSLWGKKGAVIRERHDVWAPDDPATDPLAHWKTMNRAMTENPPAARDALLLKTFATIRHGRRRDGRCNQTRTGASSQGRLADPERDIQHRVSHEEPWQRLAIFADLIRQDHGRR
jgi:hypothetical protein